MENKLILIYNLESIGLLNIIFEQQNIFSPSFFNFISIFYLYTEDFSRSHLYADEKSFSENVLTKKRIR